MPDLATWWPALLLAAVPSLLYVAVLRFIDRYEPDPWRFLLAALLIGAFVVPLLAMATRALFGQPFSAQRRRRACLAKTTSE